MCLTELAKKIADSGSQICSHTQSHQQLNAISADATLSEITTAFTEIENASGVKTTTMRPPYGAIDSSVWLECFGHLEYGLARLEAAWSRYDCFKQHRGNSVGLYHPHA